MVMGCLLDRWDARGEQEFPIVVNLAVERFMVFQAAAEFCPLRNDERGT